MADNQAELKELFETGTSDRQIQQAKERNKKDAELLIQQAKKNQAKKGLKGYSSSEEVKKFDENYKKGGKVSSASKRADGCCIRGKTRA